MLELEALRASQHRRREAMAAPPPQLSTDDLITGYLVAEESAVASNSSPAQIAERISAKNVSLLGFIKMLGPALVAESPQKRARGALQQPAAVC